MMHNDKLLAQELVNDWPKLLMIVHFSAKEYSLLLNKDEELLNIGIKNWILLPKIMKNCKDLLHYWSRILQICCI